MYIDKETLRENMLMVCKRPGLYVGEARLDKMWNYFCGWYHFGREDIYSWSQEVDMHRWLFMTESASIAHAASLNGWSILRRCYGNESHGIKQLEQMLTEIPFSEQSEDCDLKHSVSHRIFNIYAHYHWGADGYPIDEKVKNIIGAVGREYENIITIAARMIPEPYQQLWIYIHYERYFMQVRFLYYTDEKGWTDNTELTHLESYFDNLLILHAYAALIQKESHKNNCVTIHQKDGETTVGVKKVKGYWEDAFKADFDTALYDKNPFCKSYAAWKESVITQ